MPNPLASPIRISSDTLLGGAREDVKPPDSVELSGAPAGI